MSSESWPARASPRVRPTLCGCTRSVREKPTPLRRNRLENPPARKCVRLAALRYNPQYARGNSLRGDLGTAARNGDCFIGYCARVDVHSLAEGIPPPSSLSKWLALCPAAVLAIGRGAPRCPGRSGTAALLGAAGK